ncbi:MAG: hypothetical protein AB3N13_12135 [Arenibacterium sp.]
MLPKDYDAWILRGPEERHEVGKEPGDECGRYSEPDEDCPIPAKCNGEMIDDCGVIICDTCGELV